MDGEFIMFEPINLYKTIQKIILSEITKLKGVQIWKVTEINKESYTVNIRDLNFKRVEFTEVPIAGIGLGHFKGIYKLPSVDDLVLVSFLGDTDLRPVVVGTLLDNFTQSPDSPVVIQENELFMTNKTFGSIIFIKNNNTIEMRVPDSSGDLTAGARIRLSPDGSFKLFNKGNYGIECDSSGNVTIRGVTINNTNSAGTF